MSGLPRLSVGELEPRQKYHGKGEKQFLLLRGPPPVDWGPSQHAEGRMRLSQWHRRQLQAMMEELCFYQY